MIIWFTGNTGAGKTALARRVQDKYENVIILDGDELRAVWPGLSLSDRSRWTQGVRTARLAKMLESQGFLVVVSVICPFEELRQEVKAVCGCDFYYLPGGREGAAFPYEIPQNPKETVSREWQIELPAMRLRTS